MRSKTNIVVTGGAGFIGSNFIYYILNKYPDYNVICVDSLTYAGNLMTLSKALSNQNFVFEYSSICNSRNISRIFNEYRPKYVVNFAAESHVDKSIKNPKLFLQTNIIGTQVLLDASMKYGVNRYHQVSTDEVYGDLPLEEKEMFFTELSPIHTSSPYSASKASADLLTQSYIRTYNIDATISRCSNNYGPNQFPEKLIPLSISKALNNEEIPIFGKGVNIRDWLHVSDHCNAIDLILHNAKSGQVYNIGGHNERTNIEVVKTILGYLNKSDSLIKFVKDRAGHDRRYAIDPQKIKNDLGWSPTIDFEVGIIKTINWYLDNIEWCEKIKDGSYKIINNKMKQE